MKELVLLVEMKVRPGKLAEFMPLIVENGRRSFEDEPGCTRFDVLAPDEGGDRVMLYEIYVDDAAFDAHRRTPHYLRFKELARDLLESTKVQRYRMTG